MASYFDGPNLCDDADFRSIRYRDTLPTNHPVWYIEKFISGLDISAFEKRYKVGENQVGRAPKDVRMMLCVILYAIFQRIYSARRIDYATQHQADFWFFTYGKRISHDKISDFVNLHEEDLHSVFLETIHLAHTNSLLNFNGLFEDGFLLKANASKRRSQNMQSLTHRHRRISDRLDVIIEELKDKQIAPTEEEEKKRLEKALREIEDFKRQLNEKIDKRTHGKAPSKAKLRAQNATINMTDPDADLMRKNDKPAIAGYLKVCAVDSEADIVVASTVEKTYDEPTTALPLFEQANKNCDGFEQYDTVVADSGFVTTENCVAFENADVNLIGPTPAEQHQLRTKTNEEFTYDEKSHTVCCPMDQVLIEESRYCHKYKETTIVVFSNPKACAACPRLCTCTTSKLGHRKVRIDIRRPAVQRVVQRYRSPQGQALYKKRSHSGETFQGDLKQNGRFVQLLRRGLKKVRVDSTLHDTVWNLRRIFNATNGNPVMAIP